MNYKKQLIRLANKFDTEFKDIAPEDVMDCCGGNFNDAYDKGIRDGENDIYYQLAYKVYNSPDKKELENYIIEYFDKKGD